jgi:hypothetical protein
VPLDPRTLDAATTYTIDGFEPSGPWRCLYADRSETVFETIRIKLLVSTDDLTELEPGHLHLTQPAQAPPE